MHDSIHLRSTYYLVTSVHISVVPTRQIYMKYDMGDFTQNTSRQPKFGYNEAKTLSTVHEDIGTFYCWW
jgi:hypothetical protein